MLYSSSDFHFVSVRGGEYELGWRFDELLPNRTETVAFMGGEKSFLEQFSPRRMVAMQPFAIAAISVAWEDLKDWAESALEKVDSLPKFCKMVDRELRKISLRLPTEDELEVAVGDGFFAWGNEVPRGIPYAKHTDFERHREPNAAGILFNHDTYRVEITAGQLKLGDGGAAVCGGYDWPIPWLSLCPAHRLSGIDECFWETLENAQIRPVKLG